jgi:hypothetical protein
MRVVLLRTALSPNSSNYSRQKIEYVEKQPTLEEIFLALVGNGGKGPVN